MSASVMLIYEPSKGIIKIRNKTHTEISYKLIKANECQTNHQALRIFEKLHKKDVANIQLRIKYPLRMEKVTLNKLIEVARAAILQNQTPTMSSSPISSRGEHLSSSPSSRSSSTSSPTYTKLTEHSVLNTLSDDEGVEDDGKINEAKGIGEKYSLLSSPISKMTSSGSKSPDKSDKLPEKCTIS